MGFKSCWPQRVVMGIKYPVFYIVLLLLPFHVLANDTLEHNLRNWLDVITASALKHSYEGIFVYRYDAQIMAMQVVHSADGTNEQEKITSLSGPEHQILQQGRSLALNFKESQRALQGSQSTEQRPDFDETLMVHYGVNAQGTDRIAGRETRVVRIVAKDQYRYGYDLWLDLQTNLVLRSDMVNSKGDIIEQVMFTEISLVDFEHAQAQMSVSGDNAHTDKPMTKPAVSGRIVNVEWQIGEQPEGFVLTSHYVKPASKIQLRYEHMVLTDGLASVSVFIEKVTSDSESLVGQRKMGAVNAFGRVINDYQVTVVGDVPAVTVKLIAQSVRLKS
ncbi:Sigma factor RpoE negative regulatory protein RseB precursor [hydrothermal vent metagenome]|uniref:Sigma factor RpoE negative regulatory protein RseB n=1 Tax=hydrothermal vent metagenome TaxID=652676 RepID=A0A3B0ZFS2_9ZZZZ